ncbi:hypothetical protein vseg_015844 [Gypsophila vaccaria]
MGNCASTPNNSNKNKHPPIKRPGQNPVANVVKVITIDGKVMEFNPPVSVEQVLFHNPGCFVCSLDSLVVDAYPTQVAESEVLSSSRLYFVLPKGLGEKPMSLDELCELAIKASSNLSIHDLHLSFRYYATF